MPWNYRVVKQVFPQEEESFDVCEVYFGEDGKPHSFSSGKNVLSHDSYDDLKWANEEIQKAFQKPVLLFENGTLSEIRQ